MSLQQLVGLHIAPELLETAAEQVARVIARDVHLPRNLGLAKVLIEKEMDRVPLQILEPCHEALQDDPILDRQTE